MTLLTGKAIEWAAAVWEMDSLFQRSYAYFIQQLRDVFEHPARGRDVSTQLLQMSQGSRSAADFAIEFKRSQLKVVEMILHSRLCSSRVWMWNYRQSSHAKVKTSHSQNM